MRTATTAAGLTALTSRLTAWGTGAFDFDNDGYKDLFTANSAILDNAMEVQHQPFALPNSLFHNKGGLRFEDLSALAGADFAVPSRTPRRSIWRSEQRRQNRCCGDGAERAAPDSHESVPKQEPLDHPAATGTKSNRDGLGTRVKITTAHGSQYNSATTAVGYNSSSDKRIHFGLGESSVIDKIELWWPSGIRQVLTNVRADHIHSVREPLR